MGTIMSTEPLSLAAAPDVLTVEEVALVLRVSPGVVYRMIHRGELPNRRAGRRILIPRVPLQGWLHAADHEDARP